MYPNTPNSKFDLDYYAQKHMALVAIGHLYFNSMDEFQKAFGTHAQEIMADVPNFTDIEPQFQISEVVG